MDRQVLAWMGLFYALSILLAVAARLARHGLRLVVTRFASKSTQPVPQPNTRR